MYILHRLKTLILPSDYNLFKEIFFLSLPVVFSNISRVFMHLTDTAMVGRIDIIGKNAISAVGYAGTIMWVAISVGIGLRAATQAVVARRLGQEIYDECGTSLRNGQLLCLLIALPLSLCGYFFIDNISPYLPFKDDVRLLCVEYISIASFSIYFTVASFIFVGFYTGIEKTKILLYITVASNLLNVYLNAAFIYGTPQINDYFDSHGISWMSNLWAWKHFPAPENPISGAAWATVISSVFMMLSYFIYLFNAQIRMRYRVFRFNFNLKMIYKQISIGYPIALSDFFMTTAFLAFFSIIAKIGIEQQSATHVVFAIAHASFLPAVGVGQACSTLVGKYLGKENIKKASNSMKEGLRVSYLIMGTMGIIFILFPEPLVKLFTYDESVINLASRILPFVGALQFIDCVAITLWFALSGAGDTKFTSIVGILSHWLVFIPLSYIFGITLGWGVWGPWIAFGLSLFLEAVLIIFRVKQGKWKHIEV